MSATITKVLVCLFQVRLVIYRYTGGACIKDVSFGSWNDLPLCEHQYYGSSSARCLLTQERRS